MEEGLFKNKLQQSRHLWVKQTRELIEMLGYESRNRYVFYDSEMAKLGEAIEVSTGFLGSVFRNIWGHWREFRLSFVDESGNLLMIAKHPFRFYFRCFELQDKQGKPIGSIERGFSWFGKKASIKDAQGREIFSMDVGFWKIWSFPVLRRGEEVASVNKKWSGLLTEAVLDKDNFQIQFSAVNIDASDKMLFLALAVYIDILYFEKKAGS